jgi:hypothetical protein
MKRSAPSNRSKLNYKMLMCTLQICYRSTSNVTISISKYSQQTIENNMPAKATKVWIL